MTKYNTVFDRNFRKEEKDFLTENVIDKQSGDTKMLLRSYSTEIFEPRTEELSTATADDFKQFLDKTANVRKHMVAKKIFSTRINRVLACAASLVVVCGLALFFGMNGQNGSSGTLVDNAINIGEFRGQSEYTQFQEPIPEKIQQLPKEEENKEPLAYLIDVNGKVLVKHGEHSSEVDSSCEVLYEGDIVSLKKKSFAKVMYEDSFFDITGPSEYQIASPSPLKVGIGNNQQIVEPTFTTRGAGFVNTVNTIALAPKMLIAQIAAPVTRAGGDNIDIYSPHGASFSQNPTISIGGDSKETYTVSVLDLMGDAYGKAVQIKGNSAIVWSEISNEPLQTDEIYTIKVTLNGKIVNDANNSNFWLLAEDETDKLNDAFKRFNKLESKEAKDFFKANALYMNGCYSEAREIAMKLDQKNQIYANLVKLCNKTMGIKEE